MDYEVNRGTLVIFPTEQGKSKVIEKDNEYIVDQKPYCVMEHSCSYFGSSLNGRLSGSKNMLGTIYKAPILVEESNNIIFFPTNSPKSSENIWISLNNIEKYEKKDNKTVIYFNNHKQIEIDIPYFSIDNQILRSAMLESMIKKRKIV
jgi:competence protein ComK